MKNEKVTRVEKILGPNILSNRKIPTSTATTGGGRT